LWDGGSLDFSNEVLCKVIDNLLSDIRW